MSPGGEAALTRQQPASLALGAPSQGAEDVWVLLWVLLWVSSSLHLGGPGRLLSSIPAASQDVCPSPHRLSTGSAQKRIHLSTLPPRPSEAHPPPPACVFPWQPGGAGLVTSPASLSACVTWILWEQRPRWGCRPASTGTVPVASFLHTQLKDRETEAPKEPLRRGHAAQRQPRPF